jgi:hypothetical protein
MNKIFYILLFLSISGAGVLWWLWNSLPPQDKEVAQQVVTGLRIEEDHKEGEKGEHETSDDSHSEETATSDSAVAATTHSSTSTSSSEVPVPETSASKSAAVPQVANSPKSSLFVESVPAGALLYVDGVLKGKTPFTFEVKGDDKIVRLEADGFEKTEKVLEPHHRSSGALTRWKIDLKRMTEPAKAAQFQEADYRLVGRRGPFFIQLKAVEGLQAPGWLVAVQNYRDRIRNAKVFACGVDLDSKGKWTRFLMGPFDSKNAADGSLSPTRTMSGEKDAFVTGEQECRE